MPNIFHQTVEDILKCASPAQKLIWNDLFLRFGERLSISQYVYSGLIAGNEMLTYAARKLYFAYRIQTTPLTFNAGINLYSLQFYDELNAQKNSMTNGIVYWDTTAAAARYHTLMPVLYDIWFSRFANTANTYILFEGYRITY